VDHLEGLLEKSRTKGKRIIVSESVFSMDGDRAPVEELARLAKRYEALLVIDEAHAIGVMGVNGGGVCRVPGAGCQPDIVVGTMSKSLGGYGGFVACSRTVRRLLINKARSFLFSTGLPPACLGSSRRAVSIVASTPDLGKRLLEKAGRFRALLAGRGLRVPPFESHILPILIGGNEEALRFSELLFEKGLIVKAIRPPTVPVGASRVRLSVTLSIGDETLDQAAEEIGEAAKELGLGA